MVWSAIGQQDLLLQRQHICGKRIRYYSRLSKLVSYQIKLLPGTRYSRSTSLFADDISSVDLSE